MKLESKRGLCRFELRQPCFGNTYYLERIIDLEKALAKRPRQLQIDILGEGQIPADTALLIRSILCQRSPRTRVITNARSSLCGGSVLVWLMGATRLIREDAKLYFHSVDTSEISEVELNEPWKDPDSSFVDSFSEADPAEDEYARMLDIINEFLPVKEMAGRLIGVPVLRQFGLVDSKVMDQFLSRTFKPLRKSGAGVVREAKERQSRAKSKVELSDPKQN